MSTPSPLDRTQFLTDVADAMHALATRANDVAGAYRCNDLVTAHASLAAVMDELRRFTDVVTALSALGVDRHALADAGLDLDARVNGFRSGIEAALGAHARQDWLSLADTLEWDLAPELQSWTVPLRQLADGHHVVATP